MNDADFPVADVLRGIEAAAARGPRPDQGQHGRQARHQRRRDRRRWRATSKARPSCLRFIEYMDVGATNGWRMDEVLPSAE
jgi:cyclic pyranopterin phosphate synthase